MTGRPLHIDHDGVENNVTDDSKQKLRVVIAKADNPELKPRVVPLKQARRFSLGDVTNFRKPLKKVPKQTALTKPKTTRFLPLKPPIAFLRSASLSVPRRKAKRLSRRKGKKGGIFHGRTARLSLRERQRQDSALLKVVENESWTTEIKTPLSCSNMYDHSNGPFLEDLLAHSSTRYQDYFKQFLEGSDLIKSSSIKFELMFNLCIKIDEFKRMPCSVQSNEAAEKIYKTYLDKADQSDDSNDTQKISEFSQELIDYTKHEIERATFVSPTVFHEVETVLLRRLCSVYPLFQATPVYQMISTEWNFKKHRRSSFFQTFREESSRMMSAIRKKPIVTKKKEDETLPKHEIWSVQRRFNGRLKCAEWKQLFTRFCAQSLCLDNMLFFEAVEHAKECPSDEQRLVLNQKICYKCIGDEAKHQINISSKLKETILKNLSNKAVEVQKTLFDEAQKEILSLMEKDVLQRFEKSDLFQKEIQNRSKTHKKRFFR